MEISHISRIPALLAGLVLLALAFPRTSQAIVECDSEYVVVKATIILVSANGADDTVNIQCAVDLAVEQGIPLVRLKAGDFIISSLVFNNFNGTLQGNTRTSTSITTLENGLDCTSSVASGRTPAVIKFVGGRPTLRYMNITFARPCDRDNLVWAIHFTGREATLDCVNDVMFAAIDRVDLVGLDTDLNVYMNGVAATSEGHWFGGACNTNLTGTFSVNRSTFSYFHSPIITSMQSASPVDIRFNDFMNFDYGVWVRDSNQDTTIAQNNFMLGSYLNDVSMGVRIFTAKDNAPPTTTLKISKNTFSALGDAIAIRDTNISGGVEIILWVANNIFDWSAGVPNVGFALLLADINNGVVSGNLFKGDFSNAVYIGNPSHSETISGWSVTGNIFDNEIEGYNHVVFDSRVTNSVFAPGQPGRVDGIDHGSNNHMLND